MKWLFEKFESFADRPAIIDKGQIYSYHDLLNETKSLLKNFQQQITSGNTVALIGKYSVKSIAAFFALYEENHIIALFTDDNGVELDFKLNILQPNIVVELINDQFVISRRIADKDNILIKALKQTADSGLVLFSSGTSGKPKAILHNLDSLINKYKRDYSKELNIIPLLGFDHIGGLDMMLSQIAIGATITIPENRTPEYICETIEKYRVNVISASPTFLNLLLISEASQDYDLSSLQIIGYGSEPMPDWLLQKLNAIFKGVSFQQKYGLSETNALRIKSKSKDSLFFKIDDSSVEYKIVENELWLRGSSIFSGYINSAEDAFSVDGWFRTGDIIEKDNEGYFRILGRKSDIINVGGEKVFPSEIESALLQLPFIQDCQVSAEKSVITGNIIIAHVVSSSELPFPLQKQEIRKFLLNNLERYKIPVKVIFVDSIQYNERMKKIRKTL